MSENFDIFSGSKFVESLRNGGYQDTSYAIGELVDNSIDAHAKHVEIICIEKLDSTTKRYRLESIAVLDDGDGMDKNQLRHSLLFGSGNRGEDPTDIGKFGMGLPNSSLSQCKRVDVHSWQNSSSLKCFLDIDEIRRGNKQIPEPILEEVPNIFSKIITKHYKNHGTLVIWNKLDRCSWVTSNATLVNSNRLIGRIYRKFLNDKRLEIITRTIRLNDMAEIEDEQSEVMLPNDPMYLMAPSSTPGDWGKVAMFQPNVPSETRHQISYDGKKHEIIVRYSIEKDELRDPATVKTDIGNTELGRHAGRNAGISIIRADREIAFDIGLMSRSDPRDRYWGVEIVIPPSLDIPLLLTNNKQHVVLLSNILKVVNLMGDDESEETRDIEEADRTTKELFRMVREIKSVIRSMSNRIRLRRKNTRDTRTTKNEIDIKIDASIEKEIEDGESSQSDIKRMEMEKDERIEEITERLKVLRQVSDEKARQEAEVIVENDQKIIFEKDILQGSNFFDVVVIGGGVMQITLNVNHPAYENLIALTESDEVENLNCEQKLKLLKEGLELLLASWARLEDLTVNDEKRIRIQNIRLDWGRELDHFLSENKNDL